MNNILVFLEYWWFRICNFGLMVAYAAPSGNSIAETETQVSDRIAIQQVVNTDGRATVGGGEVLFFLDNSDKQKWYQMNEQLINQIKYLPLARVVICFFIICIFFLLVLNVIGLGNGISYGGLEAEINNINLLRKRDAKILRNTKFLSKLTNFIDSCGLGVDPSKVTYLEYNLKRAGYKHPNGQRTLSPSEYNAILKGAEILFAAVGLLVALRVFSLGVSFAIVCIVLLNIVPELILRETVLSKDRVIKNNFFDFYGELHYPMISNTSSEPLIRIIRSYSKVDLVDEMREFTNNVADLFDLYGEYEGSKYVAMEYKEIPEVSKLMRLIRQYNEAADIEQDMIGFREQLLLQQQINIDKHCDKLIGRARKSFVLIYAILVQAILSAMLIYLQDLGGVSTLIK